MPRRRRKPRPTPRRATLSALRRRLSDLEGRVPAPPDPAAEARWQQDVKDLDEIAGIIGSSGDEFDDLLAQVQERHPGWTPHQKQLQVKKILILNHPDGGRLWSRVADVFEPAANPQPNI